MELTGFPAASREQVMAVHDPRFVAALDRLATPQEIDPAPTYATASTAADAYLVRC